MKTPALTEERPFRGVTRALSTLLGFSASRAEAIETVPANKQLTFSSACGAENGPVRFAPGLVASLGTSPASSERNGALAVPTGIRALFSIFAFLAMFCHCAYAATTWTVTNANDSGAGSLRQAMTDAQTDDGTIVFDSSLAGFTITLASELPAITQSLTIEGNGITISGNNACRIMYIQAQGRVITIRRVHFKDGVAGGSRGGGAIRKDGSTLNLQSCIFSGNSANQRYSDGGALHNGVGALNVQGCTFYNNSSLGRGGAIYQDGSTVTLTGNIFYGNTASSGGDVIYRNSSSVTSGGYNVYDGASTYFSFNADNNTLPDIFNFNATLQHYDLSANSRRPGGGQTARPAFFACGLSDG